jgi:hypothetical protein
MSWSAIVERVYDFVAMKELSGSTQVLLVACDVDLCQRAISQQPL